jgi:hypothetical protein
VARLRTAVSAAILVGAGLLGGCVGYSSYPEVESLASSSPNFIQVKPVVEAALLEVIERYHPDWAGVYAVNLPVGMTAAAQEAILANLDDNARAMTRENAHLPTYSVGRIWVRGAKAKVDVIRPVLEIGPKPDGGIVYQGMTVWLDAGLNPWRVDFVQPWSIGVVEAPALNFVDEVEEVNESGDDDFAEEVPDEDPSED